MVWIIGYIYILLSILYLKRQNHFKDLFGLVSIFELWLDSS